MHVHVLCDNMREFDNYSRFDFVRITNMMDMNCALLCRHLMMTQLVITELSLLHSYELLLTMSVCMAALKLSYSVEFCLSLCYSDLIEQLQLKIQSQSINREF